MVLLRNLPPPTEGVRHLQADTAAVVGGQRLGGGTLYVAETRLSWLDGSGMGFCLEYPSIGLHAISRDASAFPQEHLYVMVNGRLSEENEGPMGDRRAEDEESGSSGDEEEEGVITEVRFVPGDKTCLEPLFAAMCECQALHPDPEDQDSDNEFEGEEYDVEEAEAEHGSPLVPSFYTCEEGLSSLTAEGRATLQRLEGLLQGPRLTMGGVRTEEPRGGEEDGMEVDPEALEDGQFEDADVDH